MKKLTIIACVLSSLFIFSNANATQVNSNEALSQKQVTFLEEVSYNLLHSDDTTAQTLLLQYQNEAQQLGLSQYLSYPDANEPPDCAAATEGYDQIFANAINAIAGKELPSSTKLIAATGTLHGALVAAITATTVPIYQKKCTKPIVTALNVGKTILNNAVTAYLLVN